MNRKKSTPAPEAREAQTFAALRLVNPLNVLARFAHLRRGDDDTLGAFLQRDYGPLLGDCDVEAVASSIEEDAAEVTAILQEYRAPLALEYDDDDEVHCEICDSESPYRERLENDAADVAMEAGEPLLTVLLWMHAGGLSSMEDGITGMADNYRKSLEEAREAERESLDRYKHVFFGGNK